MKRLLIVAGLVFVGVLGWRIGDLVSRDVLVMSIGILFGVMASIPAALLLLASQRRNEDQRVQRMPVERPQQAQPQIILMGGGNTPHQYQQPQQQLLPPPHPQWRSTGGAGDFKMLSDDEVRNAWGE